MVLRIYVGPMQYKPKNNNKSKKKINDKKSTFGMCFILKHSGCNSDSLHSVALPSSTRLVAWTYMCEIIRYFNFDRFCSYRYIAWQRVVSLHTSHHSWAYQYSRAFHRWWFLYCVLLFHLASCFNDSDTPLSDGVLFTIRRYLNGNRLLLSIYHFLTPFVSLLRYCLLGIHFSRDISPFASLWVMVVDGVFPLCQLVVSICHCPWCSSFKSENVV